MLLTLLFSLPIQGTNVKLNSVEDIMAWREERRKKWLSKIAGESGPKRGVKRRRPQKQGLKNSVERQEIVPERRDEGVEEEEGEVSESPFEESEGGKEEASSKADLPKDEQHEGGLSEGEIFVPKKLRTRRRKPGPREREQAEVICDDKALAAATLDQSEVGAIISKKSKVQRPKVTPKKNGVCRRWLHNKCPNGNKCRYLHKAVMKNVVKAEEGTVEEKPKSFYAAVCPVITLLIFSYCRVKWREKTSFYYKHYCISESVGC